ncbi:MAG: aminotransferase class I/II-fold pyridoxal phosphate-dependent enzyme [Candidatus Aminicenantes bacterium]|nr:aminotransferase class I/II-fold pyridoxal phosphate-dependent enzyme [Candidatus Aminicenantes bacterium]
MKLEPFALERFFARHEFGGAHVLCASDCETFTAGELLALDTGAEEKFAALRLGYTETAGNPELRREIAGLYQGIAADDILVFAGAEEAIFVFMNAVLNAGDHLLVHSPCYQSLTAVAEGNGCRVTCWQATQEKGWELDLEFLEDSTKGAPQALVVNFPHNPTGYLPSRDSFERMLQLAEAKGWLVFSDEVYRFLEYKPENRLPAACEVYENGVSLGVMSKSFGLAGLRLGWIACRNRDILKKMAAFKDYTTICTAAPSEFLSSLALRHHETILKRNREIIGRNLDLLRSFMQRNSEHFSWQEPLAGPVAFPCVNFDEASDAFCAGLLEKQGVLLLPGLLFSAAPAQFRIGFGRRDFQAGLEKLAAYMRESF